MYGHYLHVHVNYEQQSTNLPKIQETTDYTAVCETEQKLDKMRNKCTQDNWRRGWKLYYAMNILYRAGGMLLRRNSGDCCQFISLHNTGCAVGL